MTAQLLKDDERNFACGYEIYSSGYCDQPYVVITKNGDWLCVFTTASGEEGEPGQHIVSMISKDKGKSWSQAVQIEPSNGPHASWATPLIIPSGRIYVFYTYNADNMREVIAGDDYSRHRVDTLGKYAFKYSDDNGLSWSNKRYYIPMRTTDIDRRNPYGGKIHFFWSICKPIIDGSDVFVAASKVESFGYGFIEKSEGVVFKSDNILTEGDPEKINWQMYPEGEIGLKAEKGVISEEHNLVGMQNEKLYCVARTVGGAASHYYSNDRGKNWTSPEFMKYSTGGKIVKNPRACAKIWKTHNSKYLFWYHNNSTKWYNHAMCSGNRNVVWLSGGIEKNSFMHWSQPEIVLYDDEHLLKGASYPDLIEDETGFYLTSTQKTTAKVHKLDDELLEGLWNQDTLKKIAQKGLLLDIPGAKMAGGVTVDAPKLEPLSGQLIPGKPVPMAGRGGLTIDLWIRFSSLAGGQIIVDSRDAGGRGFVLATTDRETVKFEMSDGGVGACWECDLNLLKTDMDHHIVVIVDGGPKIISYVIDGVLCDGGENRDFGWGRFSTLMKDINGSNKLKVGYGINGELKHFRFYNRYIRVSEAVGNFNAGFAG